MDKIPAVYFMANKKNGTLYVGSASDVMNRVSSHKARAVPGFTKKYGLMVCVYVEVCPDTATAIWLERRYKHYKRDWKIALIEKENPEWEDVFEKVTRSS
jgi:putative endonuclease